MLMSYNCDRMKCCNHIQTDETMNGMMDGSNGRNDGNKKKKP
jgi:hypothetical protein